MPLLLDATVNAENEIADSLTRKFPLEWSLEQRIRKYFKEIARNEANNFRAFGAPVSLDDYMSGFQEILYQHYLKVANLSSRDFLDDLNKQFELSQAARNAYEADKDQRVTLFALTNSANTAAIITETNKKDFEKAVLEVATLDAIAELNDVDYDFADEFEDEFFDEVEDRAALIAATETHKGFEAGKYIAAGALAAAAALSITKTWITTLDGKQRETHELAHMQEKPLSEPFEVGGELLNVPGDPSASPAEIINCGCICIYSIEGVEISRSRAVRPR